MQGMIAIVRDPGKPPYAVLAVKDSAVEVGRRDETLRAAQAEFGPRTVIMGARRFKTWGPEDVVRKLKRIHPSQLPWREVRISA